MTSENSSILSRSSTSCSMRSSISSGTSLSSLESCFSKNSRILSHSKKKSLRLNHVIKISLNYMRKNNIKLLDLKEHPKYGSCWSDLCIKIHGKYNYTKATKIYDMYKKNKHNFKTILINYFLSKKCESHLSMDNSSYSFKMLKSKLEKYKTNSIRPKVTNDFSHLLSKELQVRCNVNCYLKSHYNWFASPKYYNSDDRPIWRGLYKCQDKDCLKEFKIVIKNHGFKGNEVVVNVKWNGLNIHKNKLSKLIRITGKKRTNMALEIVSKGNQLFNATHKKIKYAAIRKIKSEFFLRDRFSSDIVIDSESIKRSYDKLYPPEYGTDLSGYIQEISNNPFGLLLISQIQIKMWSIVQINNPIWYFDASGQYLKNVPDQGDNLLYTICCHDVERKKIIPVAEFFSTSRNTTTITTYLIKIKDTLEKNIHSNVQWKMPSIFVLDNAWSNINAALRVFNNCTAEQYIAWAFETMVLENDIVNFMVPTLIHFCCVHYLKNIIDEANTVLNFNQIKKKFKNYDYNIRNTCLRVRSTFIQSFCLLQNSVSFKEFEEYFEKIFIIFRSKYMNNNVQEALADLKEICKNKNMAFEKNLFEKKSENLIKKKKFADSIQKKSSLLKNSLFRKYFANAIRTYEKLITNNNNKKEKRNPFYNHSLLNIILRRIHLMPFWSGILISSRLEPSRSRLSNMVSEIYVDIARNDQLNNSKKLKSKSSKLMPSQFISVKFPILSHTYESNYESEYKNNFKRDLINKSDFLLNQNENWNYFYTAKSKRTNYYSNTNNFGLYSDKNNMSTESNNVDEQIDCDDGNNNDETMQVLSQKDFYKKFYESFKNSKISNGGNYNDINIINSCSIDYFLLIIYYLSSLDKSFNRSFDNHVYARIADSMKTNVNEARYLWITHNNFPLLDEHNIMNCFNSEHEAYIMKYTEDNQSFWWESVCDRCIDENIFKNDKAFILKNNNTIKSKYLINPEKIEKCPKCNGGNINNSSPRFYINDPKLILVQPDQSYKPNLNKILRSFNLRGENNKYHLIGFTVKLPKHFNLSLFDGKNFFKIDNLVNKKPEIINKNIKNLKITNIFYYKFQ